MSAAERRDPRRAGAGEGDAPSPEGGEAGGPGAASGEGGGSTVEIRRARPGDLPAVLGIERASFALPWSEAAFRAVMRREHGVLLVAEEEGEVAGYAALWFAADEAELGDVAVAPDRRRRGVAGRLLAAVRRVARSRGAARIYLQVREGNVAARKLYVGAGYREVGRRRRYYRSPPEDALVYRRELGPEDGGPEGDVAGRGHRGPRTDADGAGAA